MNERWREQYLNEHPDHDLTEPVPVPTIKFRNAVTQELFEGEAADVKEKVEREREKLGQEEFTDLDAADGLDQKERERIKTAQQFQTYIPLRSS